MKFDFVIGNPPYQEERQGKSNTATPVYNCFMDSAYKMSERTILITPARFLFNAGYTPKAWNKKMLNDKHFKVLDYIQDSSKAFPGVDIKGGVAITYRDEQKDFGAIKIFTQFPELCDIQRKVTVFNKFRSIKDIIVSSFAYHYTRKIYEENPNLQGRASSGHEYDLQSNAFSKFGEVFKDKPVRGVKNVRILGSGRNVREWKYINRKYITDVINLDTYKAFFPKATGTGKFGETLPEAVIGHPGDGATVTFLSIGIFASLKEAENLVKYTKTKFTRTLLGILKVTQDNTPEKWKYVPIQNFAEDSDIDWCKSVAEIDQQLYKKYGLTQEEIDFIESNVKEME